MKNEIIESLSKFFGIMEKYEIEIPRFYNKKRSRKINPTDFTIIGGASLVLQDKLNHTSDIDMFTPDTTPVSPALVARAIKREGYESSSHYFHKLGVFREEFSIDGMKYDIFYDLGLENLLAKPLNKKKVITCDDMQLIVRPYKYLLNDAKKILDDPEVIRPGYKLKYRIRFKELL